MNLPNFEFRNKNNVVIVVDGGVAGEVYCPEEVTVTIIDKDEQPFADDLNSLLESLGYTWEELTGKPYNVFEEDDDEDWNEYQDVWDWLKDNL